MIDICWEVWGRQQKPGDTPHGQEDQIMQVPIIPGLMKRDFFVMEVIMMATMEDSSWIGILKS